TKTDNMTLTEFKEVYGEDYASRLENASNKIKDGGNFNGTVYKKRVSTFNRDVSVYVDGKYHSLGRHDRDDVEEVEELFLSLLKDTEEGNKVEVKDTEEGNKVEVKDNSLKTYIIGGERVVSNNLS